MKICIVSSAFYPEISPRAFRATALVKELANQGHQVTLYTLKNAALHNPMEKQWNITIKDLGVLKFRRVNLHHSNRWISLIKRGLSRALLMLFEYPDIELMFKVRKALLKEKGYDLLISIAVPYPNHWGVALSRKGNHQIAKTWIADCGDPYMGERLDTFRKLFYFKYLEKGFCKKADFISVPISGAFKAYYPEFHNKIKVIPQGFDFSEASKFIQGYIPNQVPTFAYAGRFIPGKRDPRILLQHLISEKMDFRFHIYTNAPQLVSDLAVRSNGRIIVHSFIERPELISRLSTMDFLINMENGVPEQLPSKLIDYALTGRPILSFDSRNFNTQLLHNFLHGDYSARLDIHNLEDYNIKNVCAKFLALAE